MPSNHGGYLITVEGIDKAGKTTVVSAVEDLIGDRTNRDIIVSTEPNDGQYGHSNDFGNLTREKLSDSGVHPLALFHAFEADHYQHIREVVKPALERGDIVVLDRYLDSRYAYQTEALKEFFKSKKDALEWIRTVQETPSETPIPDLTLYIEISPEESGRRRTKDDQEVFENIEFLRCVKENYDELSEMFDRYATVDGMQPQKSVKSDSVGVVTELLED